MCSPSCGSLTELLGTKVSTENVKKAYETWHRTTSGKHSSLHAVCVCVCICVSAYLSVLICVYVYVEARRQPWVQLTFFFEIGLSLV